MFSVAQAVFQRFIILAASLGLILAGALPLCAQTPETAIVRVSNLNLRRGPSLNAARLMLLQKGDRVEIISRTKGWLHVRYNGQTGYIKDIPRFLQRIPTVETGQSSPEDIEQLKQKSQTIDAEIDKFENDLKRSEQTEATLLDTLNGIDLALNQAHSRMKHIEAEIEALDKKVAERQKAADALEQRIASNEAYMQKRLVALYKLSWLGKFNMLASAESLYEILQRKAFIERILDQDEKLLAQLTDDKSHYREILNRLNEQRTVQLALQADLKTEMDTTRREKAKRTRLLAAVRSQKKLEIAAIGALKEAARQLNAAVESLARTPPPPAPAPSTGPVKPFSAFKGLLQMPVSGTIISRFGRYVNPKYKIVNFQSGIDIEAEKGEPVKAVYAGRVIFADWFKGYGNMIIIDHGESYYSLYAHIEEMFKQKGAMVETGETIATVGESGSMSGVTLHFEVRHHGNPVDPLQWITLN